jgi:hypothetical protein
MLAGEAANAAVKILDGGFAVLQKKTQYLLGTYIGLRGHSGHSLDAIAIQFQVCGYCTKVAPFC